MTFLDLKKYQDGSDGVLMIGEVTRQIPFSIKRFFFIDRLSQKGAVRGMHAHRTLKQAIFCLKGHFRLDLLTKGKKEEVVLRSNGKGVLVEPMIWNSLSQFSKNCFILVLCSDVYKEDDYIRDFREFRRLVK